MQFVTSGQPDDLGFQNKWNLYKLLKSVSRKRFKVTLEPRAIDLLPVVTPNTYDILSKYVRKRLSLETQPYLVLPYSTSVAPRRLLQSVRQLLHFVRRCGWIVDDNDELRPHERRHVQRTDV